MADEIRVTDQTGKHTHRDEIAANADVEATITPDRTAAVPPPAPRATPATPGTTSPDDPETARAQIEQTRARMSETIDEIEEVLVRKKERLQDRLDVMAPVRERPLASLGIVLGAGLLLGLLTGGDDEDDRDGGWRGRDQELADRAETWERRARRLLRIAREQEDELNALSRGNRRLSDAWEADDADREDTGPSAMDRLADQVTDRITNFATSAIRGMFGAA